MERFSRTRMLVGGPGADALARTSIIILGVGGVGSYTAEALARTGVGRLRLIDGDVVEVSNINRQLHALDSSLGKAKVQVLAQRFAEINPHIVVEPIKAYYSSDNAAELLQGDFDWVVDAVDSVPAKLDIITHCITEGRLAISSMGAGNRLDATQLRIDDISKTYNCRLARVLRKKLGRQGIRKGIPVVWSPEQPNPMETEVEGQPSVPGSISFVPATAGLLMASYIVNKILQVK